MVQNSDVIKKVLTTLINVSGRKTSEAQAFTMMDSLLKKLGSRYNFLRDVEVKDTRFIEEVDPVSVMSDLDTISNDEVGKALYDIICLTDKNLGKNAGYFFIKEISRNIEEDYKTTMKNMGLDLSIMQLEREVNEMEQNITSRRSTKK
ncbi:MAG: hypothetical protein V5A64_05280 [Candidatus Thermoplasmatota archaeon]